MVEVSTYHAAAKRRLAPFALVTVAILAWRWWRPFRVAVDGDSMSPSYSRGDWLVATRRGRVRRGSVVALEHPARPGFEMIKRVAARPGDRTSDGRVMGLDRYWVLGDLSGASTDSRTFGPVPAGAIRGVVRFRYRRG